MILTTRDFIVSNIQFFTSTWPLDHGGKFTKNDIEENKLYQEHAPSTHLLLPFLLLLLFKNNIIKYFISKALNNFFVIYE